MKVIYKVPGCPAVIRDIPNTLKSLQEAVGGRIETLTFNDLVVICNEDGYERKLNYNVTIGTVPMVGAIILCGKKDGEFVELDERITQKLMQKFAELEG